ncbi:MAG TPA: tetratricopeptide repeat protein, partial [Pirellulales bacterium]|nr:tetratricopeptide repeat protein [Pirellulales bacterium]
KKLAADHPDTLATLHNLAKAYLHAGRLPEAIELSEHVREVCVRTLGADHPHTLTTLNNLAGAYQAVGRLPEAIKLFEYVRDEQAKKLGADHPKTLATLNNLATAYWSTTRLDKSVPLFEDLLKRMQALLGRNHPSTQQCVANLGVNYKDSGRLEEAVPLLEEAYHASHQIQTLHWVGAQLLDAYVKAGKTTDAAGLVQELLAEARTTVPQASPQLAGVLAQAGLTLLRVKAWTEAEGVLRECLATREKIQPDTWTTFNTKSMLGEALLGQEKYAEAEALLLAGYEGMKEHEAAIPPEGKIRLTEALRRLADFYAATGQAEKADEWRKKLEKTRATEEKPN